MAIAAGLILSAVFFILLFLGVPISVSIAAASIVTMLTIFPFDVAIFTSAQKMVTGIDSFALLAVPFFILSGIIMNNGGIAMRLINFAKLISGRLPGSGPYKCCRKHVIRFHFRFVCSCCCCNRRGHVAASRKGRI